MRSLGWRPGWDGHLLLFYDEESQRRVGVAAWVGRGLEVGSKIFYVEPQDAPPDQSLAGMLREEPDALAAMDRGQIQVIPAEPASYGSTFMQTTVDVALSEGYSSIRWSGDAPTAQRVMPSGSHELLEQTTDRLCTVRPLSVLCQYPGPESRHAAGLLSRSHGGGLREERFQAAPVEGGLAVAGELDVTNEATLRSLLVTATTEAEADPFVVDLRWVSFLDLPGARALLFGTLDHRDGGGRVLLQEPPPHVAHLLHLLGIDHAVGIQVGGRPR